MCCVHLYNEPSVFHGCLNLFTGKITWNPCLKSRFFFCVWGVWVIQSLSPDVFKESFCLSLKYAKIANTVFSHLPFPIHHLGLCCLNLSGYPNKNMLVFMQSVSVWMTWMVLLFCLLIWKLPPVSHVTESHQTLWLPILALLWVLPFCTYLLSSHSGLYKEIT